MSKETTNYGSSIRAKLLNLSRKVNQPYQMLLTRYIQERFLYRLSASEYRDRFLLKGGALLYAFDRFDARPTLDIDFLGERISSDIAHIKSVFSQISSIECVEDGVVFDSSTIEAVEITQNNQYQGVRIRITARLDSVRQGISMDIGFGDVVTPDAQILEYPLLIDDLPSALIRAYSLETVVAEKFQAMVALGESNSRMKDFFDVYRILSNYDLDEGLLGEAIRTTFTNRHTPHEESHPLFDMSFADDARRIAYWRAFLARIKWKEEVDFKKVLELIINRLQKYYDLSVGL